jgi:hypothetical protein
METEPVTKPEPKLDYIPNQPLTILLNHGMKYAEVTIIKNLETRGFFSTLLSSIGVMDEETLVDTERDIMIMKFDDEELPFNVNDRYVDLKYKATVGASDKILYIDKRNSDNKKSQDTMFLESPKETDGVRTLDFNILKNYKTDKYPKVTPSINNMILYNYDRGFCDTSMSSKNHFYGVTRLESSDAKPRYYVAYKAPFITKEEVIYITRCHLFRNWNTANYLADVITATAA